MNLPVHQVHKGQPRPAELLIDPDAEVMQGDLGGQARLQSAQLMRPFPIQAEGMMELLVDGLHNLADAREPAPPRLGPRPLTVPPGRANNLGAVERPPGPQSPCPRRTDSAQALRHWPTPAGARGAGQKRFPPAVDPWYWPPHSQSQ